MRSRTVFVGSAKRCYCTLALVFIGSVAFVLPGNAATIPFDAVIIGATSFGFDGDGDTFDDVIFSTTDPGGFNTAGPGPNMAFINEPGLEGTSLLDPDLRVDFLVGAVGSITFGFALNSGSENAAWFASFELFDAFDNSLGSALEVGTFSDLGGGNFSTFPEGEVSLAFAGLASYGLFNFTSQFGRYIIDDFRGTFGTSENVVVPEPATMMLLGIGLAGLAMRRRKKA